MDVKNKNKILKCGIVGCGNIAGNYDISTSTKIRTHAKAYLKNKNCELTCVCDVDIMKAKKFSAYWGSKYFFNNLDEFLKNNLDIISICTPTNTHKSIFEKVVASSPQVIWLEKPSSYLIKDIKKMIEISKNKVSVWVNYFRRFTKGFIDIKNSLKSIGKIQYVNCYYTKGFQHNGSHVIDLMIFFFGAIKSFKIIDKIQRGSFLDIDVILIMEKAKVNIKSLDYREFEIFEVDIMGVDGRYRIIERGEAIEFFKTDSSDGYKNYKILKKQYIKTKILDKFMSENLLFGMSAERENDLEHDLIIQKHINQIINY